MDDDFKEIEDPSLISLRIDDLYIDENKEQEDLPNITDNDIERFENLVNILVSASNDYDKIRFTSAAKDLLEGLKYYKKIPLFDFFIENNVIQLCTNYYKRYSDGNDDTGICCLGILSYLSDQSSDYTKEFQPILPILFKKIENNQHPHSQLQIQVIDILSNCMLDDNLVRIFDDFSIKKFNKNYVEQINSLEEAESVSRFYKIYLEEKAPEDILHDMFYHMQFILREEKNDNLILNCLDIFARFADMNSIDLEFFYQHHFNDFMINQKDNPIYTPLVIYFYSRCFYFNEEFRSENIFPPDVLISFIVNDEEHDDLWFKRASAATNFLSTMANCNCLSDNDMLICGQWICEGVEHAPYLLKETMFYLMQSILMNAKQQFFMNADLEAVFSFLEETVSIKTTRKHLAIAAEAIIEFTNNADKYSIDVKPPIIQSNYLNTLLDLIDECEKDCEVFDRFREKFCS